MQKELEVRYRAAQSQQETNAAIGQRLNFYDTLRTLDLSEAIVMFTDKSVLRMWELTRLEIQCRLPDTNTPIVRLEELEIHTRPASARLIPVVKVEEGDILFSSRGAPVTMPIETPQVRGVPKGTEFLVSVNSQAARTEIAMFDGIVELSDGQTNVTVRSGQQGIAIAGQGIKVRPILEAKNVVQWWIDYPAVLDPDELGLTPDQKNALSDSLAAYRAGDLVSALTNYPGYPTPNTPVSNEQKIFLSALLLSVGAVDKADHQLNLLDSDLPAANALRTLMNAVSVDLTQFTNSSATPHSAPRTPHSTGTASEWLALSYHHQARHKLERALEAARIAVRLSPEFGFGWARVAELEFSFGRTGLAKKAIEKAIALSPRNAQAHALMGFLLAAENRIKPAIARFDHAIELDSSLGNAWLGRSLCQRRLGWFNRRLRRDEAQESAVRNPQSEIPDGSQPSTLNPQPSWLSDLQTAAAVEPHRALIRSYLGKGFSEANDARLAEKELNFAKKLDPNDPTPWLYSALEKQKKNRINEAVSGLERSIKLNDNRALFRSRLLLDQDHAVRSASLARIYQDAGLDEVALNEAARAVTYDYANYSAHQFLAESYNAARDPTRFNLRYETVWFNELLLANILSPPGAGILSPSISQQEYTRLFEQNRLGLFSATEYRSDGQIRQTASQFGTYGGTSYSIDLDYQHNDGVRPNNDLDRLEYGAQFKQQLTDRDSLYLLAGFLNYESGDNFQHYDPGNASATLRIDELQRPGLIGAIHREWQPGVHTTVMGGWFETEQNVTDSFYPALELITNSAGMGVDRIRTRAFGELSYHADYRVWMSELNQVIQTDRQTLLAGVRFNTGDVTANDQLDNPTSAIWSPSVQPPVVSSIDESFQRISCYGYFTRELRDHFSLTAGIAYDDLRYPGNFRRPPLDAGQEHRSKVSPKTALTWNLSSAVTLRGMYAQALGGVAYDESIRLEPTQLAGFSQAFRTVIAETEAGSIEAPEYEMAGLALNWKLPTRTYLGVQANWIQSMVDRQIGVFQSTDLPVPQSFPGSTIENLDYTEISAGVYGHQLLGRQWVVGAAYRYAESKLDRVYPEIYPVRPNHPASAEESRLHRFSLSLHWNHPCGLFGSAESNWYLQDNFGYSPARPGDSVTQVNLLVGWRFWQRRGELALGGLNLTGEDYRLNPLTPYPDLPRERVFLARLRLNF